MLEKANVAIYICTVTKPIHLELVSSLTTDAFLASFDSQLMFLMTMVVTLLKELQTVIHSHDATEFLPASQHFIPVRLWEAGGEMKCILTVLREHKLQFEDLATILTDVKAIRSIATFDSHQEDGSTALVKEIFLDSDIEILSRY